RRGSKWPSSSARYNLGYTWQQGTDRRGRVSHDHAVPLPLQGVVPQAPVLATDMLAAAAMHALLYVLPSQPHTGAKFCVHACEGFVHVPGASAAPQCALTGKLQNVPAAHAERPREPQDAPVP